MDLKPVLSDGNALSVMRATVYTCSFIEMQRASFVTFFSATVHLGSTDRVQGERRDLKLCCYCFTCFCTIRATMTPLLSRDKMTPGNPMFFHVDFLACLKSVFPHTPEKCKKCYVICSKFKLVFPRHRLLTLPAIAYAEVNRTLYKDHGGYANHITVVEFSLFQSSII